MDCERLEQARADGGALRGENGNKSYLGIVRHLQNKFKIKMGVEKKICDGWCVVEGRKGRTLWLGELKKVGIRNEGSMMGSGVSEFLVQIDIKRDRF